MQAQYQVQQKKTSFENNKVARICSVCKSAGKTPEEYTSHWTKSSTRPDAKVICPTILNAICSYCKGTGHFKSKCSVLQSRLDEKNKTLKPVEVKPVIKTIINSKPVTNMYSILSEENKPKKETKKVVPTAKMDFPCLLTPSKTSKTHIVEETPEKMSYAKMASLIPEKKQPPVMIVDRAKEIYIQMFTKTTETEEETVFKKRKLSDKEEIENNETFFGRKNSPQEEEMPKQYSRKSWADDTYWGDWENDEDDDE
jgi:hypothetical protein